jgi:2-dehydropantoate 2-reductase
MMKIVIMGTGGVGGYYGGLLVQRSHDVTFIARGVHLDAIRTSGLQVKSIHGDFQISPAQATDDPAEIGQADLILFTVKAYDTEASAQSILPLIGPQTVVISLQNGIDAVERIGSTIGSEHLIGGATWISAAIEAPGIIKQVSQFRRIVIGELDGHISPRLEAIFNALEETGATVELTDQIQKILWSKFVFISSASAFGALTRLPMGEYRSVPETRVMIVNLMTEVIAVAKAHGVTLDDDVVQKSLAFMDNATPHIKASMQVDVEAGRQFELESMVGVISRKGRKVGIATPTADVIYAALLPVNLKAQQVAR